MRLVPLLGCLLVAVEGLRTGRGRLPADTLHSNTVRDTDKVGGVVFPGPQNKGSHKHRFLNANTTRFAVNGTNIPDVDFDVGESYAGALPISGDPHEHNKLFFWFFPSPNKAAAKEIVIWLNGGPGCSSFEGLLQEHGPFLWRAGTYMPVRNPWSWHTLTNIVYVEQPVGTGFSKGTPTITNEEELAGQFLGWWKNFIDTFSMQGYRVYITGESYAGLYCPYIASAMLDANDTTYYKVSGMMMNNAAIDVTPVMAIIPTVGFVDYWASLFPFNDTFRAHIKSVDAMCGYSEFMNAYLTFPPIANLPPLPGQDDDGIVGYECAYLRYDIINAALHLNPCFDSYYITETCPRISDVLAALGGPASNAPGGKVYFNRDDVKAAIHAPQNISWSLCPSDNDPSIFVNYTDTSDPSTVYTLPKVIDKTQNVIISHGMQDMVIPANGSLLAIQNMTWGGKLGFQNKPTEPFYVPFTNAVGEDDTWLGGWGVVGGLVSERGLTWVGVNQAGHMVPENAPAASYRHLEYLLGRVDCMNCTKPFTVEGLQHFGQAVGELGQGTLPQVWSDQKQEGYGS
ncbi:carboxypeptidase [Triangularia verruculosa]|uniref:Carboxypeptidase n=1 Tax=Triangularia verruculosa TaxID=2587418 RepID=A0AAN6XQC4_9PEZI|nr:carboxypeptidase [Triangularia verruculosa]